MTMVAGGHPSVYCGPARPVYKALSGRDHNVSSGALYNGSFSQDHNGSLGSFYSDLSREIYLGLFSPWVASGKHSRVHATRVQSNET